MPDECKHQWIPYGVCSKHLLAAKNKGPWEAVENWRVSRINKMYPRSGKNNMNFTR